MQKKKQQYLVVIIVCIVVIAALALILLLKEEEDMLNEEFPGNGNGSNGSNASVIAQGSFQDGAHPTDGKALLIEMENKFIIRLEDFKTDSGPGLYVYLSVDKTANDYVSLGKLKGTEGNMNYDVPQGTNTTKYSFVLIWCEPFSVLFGHAELI